LFTTEQLAVPVAKRKMYVLIEGEVATPGTYQVEPGETLRQLVSRVGGATPQAYLYASEFYRESTRKMQQQKLDNVLDRMEKSLLLGAASNVKTALSAEDIAAQNAQQAFTSQVLARMRTVKASGRMVLELPPGKNSIALIPDIPLEDGDRMLIPTTPAMVNVVGEIYNENAFLYKSGKALDDYLQQAGGATPEGDLRAIYVLKADGSVMSRNRGWFSGWFNTSEIMPGDTIVVPILAEKKSWTKELKDWTQILYQFGMGVAGLKVLSDL
jgi:protein involved in polysaccharide export with SLBB domain